MADLANALAGLLLFLAVLIAGSCVVVYAALSLIRVVTERFVPPAPSGVHGIPVDHPDHPERDEVELSAHDRAVLMELDIRTKWESA